MSGVGQNGSGPRGTQAGPGSSKASIPAEWDRGEVTASCGERKTSTFSINQTVTSAGDLSCNLQFVKQKTQETDAPYFRSNMQASSGDGPGAAGCAFQATGNPRSLPGRPQIRPGCASLRFSFV